MSVVLQHTIYMKRKCCRFNVGALSRCQTIVSRMVQPRDRLCSHGMPHHDPWP